MTNSVTGKLQVTDTSGAITGFISPLVYSGELRYTVTSNPDSALIVSIDLNQKPGTFTIVVPTVSPLAMLALSGSIKFR